MAQKPEQEKKPVEKNAIASREEETLAFWDEHQIFEKSQAKDAPKGEFVFYDGPPFATGLPHYGHILAGTIKDAIPRYKTMRGFRVPRVWGWDCHGLPIENLIEKELGISTKKEIEKIGIATFNRAARAAVLRYDAEWKKIVPRLGRWVDMEHAYKTMDTPYTESIWWSFKQLHDKNLIYRGFKAMHLCPHCETTLANFEVSLNYKDITDISVYIRFELVDEPGTYLLAWTTTPWTLPGNTAAAVHPEVTYVKVKSGEDFYILAKDRFDALKDKFEKPALVGEFKGTELVGKSYKPIFDYYKDVQMPNKENIWKVWAAPYVTTDTGTGVVHLAPAFGEEDLLLAQEHKFPIIHHVNTDGTIVSEVTDFAGMQAKPKDTAEEKDKHQKTDIEIIKNLAHRGHLFAKEKIVHSYPHCWRCDTPLLNYAATSWFVEVTKFKNKLVEENKKISWLPHDIGEGRFGKWLEGARDWAISRSRYWGAPLPVWQCEACKKTTVIGSIEELKNKTESGNRYLVMRHGQAESNATNVVSGRIDDPVHLTEQGKKEVEKEITKLKVARIGVIYASPFVRTKETAEMVAETLGYPKNKIIYDARLAEVNTGDFSGRPISEYRAYFSSQEEKFTKVPPNGENLTELKDRVMDFLYEIDTKHKDKDILIIAHEYPIWMMSAGAQGLDTKAAAALKIAEDFINTGSARGLAFAPIPHNEHHELDLHRPYIDAVTFSCDCGGAYKRISEVFDTWYESGSMPYASKHYPMTTKDFEPARELGFPADFIAEGVDQTRGWFYSLLILNNALFGRSPYENVVVNGIVLAEDGQKMSKRLKNYPDPMDVVNKYGADALRFYLLSSPVVHAEDLRFSERGVDEVVKKNIARLSNVLSFLKLYGGETAAQSKDMPKSGNVLDQWIVARLAELTTEMTERLERYELDKALAPVGLFVDDLSTWYLRRSRDRFKGDDKNDRNAAIQTTHFVLLETAKLLAPFMPFFAEHLYRELKGEQESVHLEGWPMTSAPDKKILEKMEETRRIVSLGLEARAKASIKVRQPLKTLSVTDSLLVESDKEYRALIEDEVNVKEVILFYQVKKIEGMVGKVSLDTIITSELKKEGQLRDLIRAVQDLRKKADLNPSDKVELVLAADDAGKKLVSQFESELKDAASLSAVSFADGEGSPIEIDGMRLSATLKK